jgi:restriction system protein
MLDHLTPRQFEEYCQTLLMQHYRCPVDLTPQTGDEGRDLLVHHPAGLRVVERKHYPNGTVGRPIVQKLHSAVLTAGAKWGMIITTGRFSSEAEAYVQQLQDVRFELLDASKLARLIATTFPNSAIPKNLATAIRTTSDAEFPQTFAKSVFSESRYRSGTRSRTPVRVERRTRYVPFYLADYEAEGSAKTARGTFEQQWHGRVWLRGDGRDAGLGDLPLQSAAPQLGALSQILRITPGDTAPPVLQPHEAASRLREFLSENCIKYVRYYGRNNSLYVRTVAPSRGRVQIHSLVLCYVPYQRFRLEIGGVCYEGKVSEAPSHAQFRVQCAPLSVCTVCGGGTTASNQILCAVCFRPAHRWGIFCPDSLVCRQCGAIVCRKHAVRFRGRQLCARCAPGGRPVVPRWVPHCVIGLAVSALAACAEVALNGTHLVGSHLIIATLVSGAGWLPSLGLLLRTRLHTKGASLLYESD